jgi:hypothetical protein
MYGYLKLWYDVMQSRLRAAEKSLEDTDNVAPDSTMATPPDDDAPAAFTGAPDPTPKAPPDEENFTNEWAIVTTLSRREGITPVAINAGELLSWAEKSVKERVAKRVTERPAGTKHLKAVGQQGHCPPPRAVLGSTRCETVASTVNDDTSASDWEEEYEKPPHPPTPPRPIDWEGYDPHPSNSGTKSTCPRAPECYLPSCCHCYTDTAGTDTDESMEHVVNIRRAVAHKRPVSYKQQANESSESSDESDHVQVMAARARRQPRLKRRYLNPRN